MPSARVPLLFAVLVLSAVLTPATKFGDSALLSARVRHALHATDGGMRARRHSTPLPTIREVPDENADVDGSDTLGLSGRLGGRHSLPHDVDGINLDPRVKQLRRLHSTGDLHPGASERLSAELKRKLPPTPQLMQGRQRRRPGQQLQTIAEIPQSTPACNLPSIRIGEQPAAGMTFQVSLAAPPPNGPRYPSFACVVVNDELRDDGGTKDEGGTPGWRVNTENHVAADQAVRTFIEAQEHTDLQFDRGHLIARSYFNDKQRQTGTYRLENMVPQYRQCNSQYWAKSVEEKVREYVINNPAFDDHTKIIVGTAGVREARDGVVLVKWMWTAVCRTSPDSPEERYPAGSYLVAAKATEKPPHPPPECGDPYPNQGNPNAQWDTLPDPPHDAPEMQPIKEWLEANCQGPWHNFQRLVVQKALPADEEERKQNKKAAKNARPEPPDETKVDPAKWATVWKNYQKRDAEW
eukprot:CAMPEP_0174833758 /NCGR_PEP_ID=MMETSP1114-20130205/4426_1 /TAXON_ID=312471 /ORGANISM="Neobodo designis, Strain CCAP 1951/1" /LENGTH=465 /DNA_ID=CAMNT_0016067651 /DNA_START=45 /DNA_END=1439 /DNA_ORIENTATION=+